jgi:hypothetical protein
VTVRLDLRNSWRRSCAALRALAGQWGVVTPRPVGHPNDFGIVAPFELSRRDGNQPHRLRGYLPPRGWVRAHLRCRRSPAIGTIAITTSVTLRASAYSAETPFSFLAATTAAVEYSRHTQAMARHGHEMQKTCSHEKFQN